MKRLMYRFVCVAAMAASMAMLAQTSAYASGGPGGFVLAGEGGGFITPGLTAVPTFQSGTFSGTFGGVAAAVNTGPPLQVADAGGVGNCNFTFSSTIAETTLQGQGTATGSCTIALVGHFTISPCTVNYLRVGVLVLLTVTAGNCSITVTPQVTVGPIATVSDTADIGAGVFLFAPTTGNGETSPVTGFALAGVPATLSAS